MRVADEPVNVMASVGIASTETFGYSLDALLHEADIATYAAKGRGPSGDGGAWFCRRPDSQESAPAGATVVFSGITMEPGFAARPKRASNK